MASLPEPDGSAYPTPRQIENGEPQGGGLTGLWNEHARALMARTNWLRSQLVARGLLAGSPPPVMISKSAQPQGLLNWTADSQGAPTVDLGGTILKMLRTENTGVGSLIAVPSAGATGSNRARLLVPATSGTPDDWGPWAEAWLGQAASQRLTENGYQVFPSGLILQWGWITMVSSSSTAILPIAFPTACLCAFANADDGAYSSGAENVRVTGRSKTALNFLSYINNSGAPVGRVSFFAVGY